MLETFNQEVSLVDPSKIYNRIKLIDNNKWKQIIAIGEQTGKLNYNELSVIRTVMLKLKKQENIDLRRLQIVNDAIERIKKFGIDV